MGGSPSPPPVGCIHSVHAREQGIWTRPRSRARPVRGSCRVSRTQSHRSWPFEVERKALRLGPASPHSVPAESGHSSPLGARPDPRSWPPCKTPGQRRISMSAPFRIRERSPTSSRTGDREGRIRAPSTWRRHPKRSYDPPNMRHEVMSSRATRVAVPVGDLRCLACPGSRRCPREENRR